MNHSDVELEVCLHIKVAHDLAVKPRDASRDNRRAHSAALMGIREERVFTDASLRTEDALEMALARVKQRDRKGAAVANQRRERMPLLHRHQQHRGIGAALLHAFDDATVADVAVRGGEPVASSG